MAAGLNYYNNDPEYLIHTRGSLSKYISGNILIQG